MSPFITSTRDAIVTLLNVAAFQPAPLTTPLVALPIYDITFNLQQLVGGRLTVVPVTKSPRLITRGGGQRGQIKIDVGLQYKFTQPTAGELDPFTNLAESIPDRFLGVQLSNGAVGLEAEFPHGLFIEQHIREFRVFTSVVTLTFLYAQS